MAKNIDKIAPTQKGCDLKDNSCQKGTTGNWNKVVTYKNGVGGQSFARPGGDPAILMSG